MYDDDDLHLPSEQLRLSLILIEKVEEVEVWSCLAEYCGLDAERVVWSVEVDPGNLRSLHTAS